MSLTNRAYESLVRPLLFTLQPESAHRLALAVLRWDIPWRLVGGRMAVRDPRLGVELGGLRVPNPVGLAPGIDKNGLAVGALSRLGFGYIVIGSITKEARPGNPKPRLRRDVPREAILNSLGLPSLGVARAARALEQARGLPVPVLASVAGFSATELVELAAAVEPHVDAVEIGLVCPNSTESERMRELEMFDEVVAGVMARRRRPVFIKLPSPRDAAGAASVAEMVRRAADAGLDGISISGSHTIEIAGFPAGKGSIAGRPAFDVALGVLRDVAGWSRGRIPIRAAGGIFDGGDAARMLAAGASAVEVYSSFIFRGPGIAGEINRGLLAELDRRGVASIPELTAGARTGPDRETAAVAS